MCVGEMVNGEKGFDRQLVSMTLVKSALGALWLCLFLHLPSVNRTALTDGTAEALAQLWKESFPVRTVGRLGCAKKVADLPAPCCRCSRGGCPG
jgi:hypothetical protein